MIEIVKRGTPYQDRFFLVTCKRCRSDLRFKGDEVSEGVNFTYIVCPVCEQWIKADEAKDEAPVPDPAGVV